MTHKLSLLAVLIGVYLVLLGATLAWGDRNNIASAANPTPTVIATIGVGDAPSCGAVNSVTNRVYVANAGSKDVSVINGATNVEVTRVPLGCIPEIPNCVAVNEVTNHIYVSCFYSGTVSVIDGATNAVVGTPIPLGGGPRGVAVDSATGCAYVADTTGSVSVICPSATPTKIPVGSLPHVVAVNSTTQRVYVANANDDNVSVINSTTNAEVTRVPVGDYPVFGLGVDPTTNRVYVSNYASDDVSVINGQNNVELTRVPLPTGSAPSGVAANSTTNHIFVERAYASDVWAFDGVTYANITTVAASYGAGCVAANPVTNRVYKCDYGTDTVLVIQDYPLSVGGIAEHAQLEPGARSSAHGSPAPNAFVLAGLATGGALLLAAGGWYARRRWSGF